jgi:hypothetical protein
LYSSEDDTGDDGAAGEMSVDEADEDVTSPERHSIPDRRPLGSPEVTIELDLIADGSRDDAR